MKVDSRWKSGKQAAYLNSNVNFPVFHPVLWRSQRVSQQIVCISAFLTLLIGQDNNHMISSWPIADDVPDLFRLSIKRNRGNWSYRETDVEKNFLQKIKNSRGNVYLGHNRLSNFKMLCSISNIITWQKLKAIANSWHTDDKYIK